MLTHFIKNINWVDIALVVLLVRVIFIGVKNGFIAELCKFLGVLLALYVSLHWYVALSLQIEKIFKGHLGLWQCLAFVVLIILGYSLFWGIRLGLSMLFTAEAQHEGFNKYAAGILAIGRGFLTVSLIIFGLLLTQQPWLSRQAFDSLSYKLAGKTATHTYSFIFHHAVAKLCDGQKFNKAVDQVVNYGINSRSDYSAGH